MSNYNPQPLTVSMGVEGTSLYIGYFSHLSCFHDRAPRVYNWNTNAGNGSAIYIYLLFRSIVMYSTSCFGLVQVQEVRAFTLSTFGAYHAASFLSFLATFNSLLYIHHYPHCVLCAYHETER